jgi:predicted O-methyltransferase YrrM
MTDSAALSAASLNTKPGRHLSPINPYGPIHDPKVRKVIERLHTTRAFPVGGGPRQRLDSTPEDFADFGFSIDPTQGDLIYLLCRSINAKRVIDFATSVGMSALYFAAAMRDNGGGKVIGAEWVQAKIDVARANLAEAGLADYAEIRAGDARYTLIDVGGPVDFALIDGWPNAEGRSLARDVIEVVAPQIRVGGYVLNDNAEPDFLEYIRDPKNGFIAMNLPIKGGTELALKVR